MVDSSSSSTTTTSNKKKRPRPNRWGDAPPPSSAPVEKQSDGATDAPAVKQPRRSRFSSAPPVPPPAATTAPAHNLSTSSSGLDATKQAKAEALKQSIQARLAALKKRPAPATAPTTAKRAKVFDLDLSVTKPTVHEDEKPREKINPYLSISEAAAGAAEADEEAEETLLDSRLAGGRTSKLRVRNKPITFVEPGTFVKIADRKREKATLASKSGFVSGRKEGTFVKSTGMVSENALAGDGDMVRGEEEVKPLPLRPDEDPTYPCPLAMEWWDAELLPARLKKELAVKERKAMASQAKKQMEVGGGAAAADDGKKPQKAANANEDEALQMIDKCFNAADLSHSKTSTLVQHPIPVKPTGTDDNPSKIKPAVLHLTKKEQKRQRKLRRAEKQRELQDKQAAGLIPPPEPRLTLSNFMKVLGDQAVMDPSKMESVVLEQIQARKLKHERMNAERALTPEQRRAKKAKKLAEDTSAGVHVALFLVGDMSHRYHRTIVDLNAQQCGITGGVLECERNPQLALVIAEGGPKSIKFYTRLMTVRMKWRGENFRTADGSDEEGGGGDGEVEEEDADETTTLKFNPNNFCELVWSGMGMKRMFNSFQFQKCATSDVARKVLEAKGVAHFWDQVLAHHARSKGGEEDTTLNLKLGGGGGGGGGTVVMSAGDEYMEDVHMEE